ncbi:MAG: hypothetical protein AAFX79_09465 [Planctomycetota bacterium]
MQPRRQVYYPGLGTTQSLGPWARVKAALVAALALAIAVIVVAGGLALAIVLLPIVLVAGLVGWLIIRRKIARLQRELRGDAGGDMPDDPNDASAGRENVRIRRPNAAGPHD